MAKSQLDILCEREHVGLVLVYGGNKKPNLDPKWQCHGYRATLRFGRRRMSCDFFTGITGMGYSREPSAADVLCSLLLDARAGEQSFEDFCADFGYDPDSRAAEATYKACRASAPKVRRFLGEAFDRFQAAEH